MMMSERNSRNPFTATQWQELHHQALIFNYMSSGMCVPHHLLFPIRRSTDHQPGLLARLFPHPQMDWGGGRKVDPEPGRCKRTDGKKWRCSKEACADSKYCERHMYRGKSRSRKPVELVTNSTTPPNPKNPSTTKDTPSSKQAHPYPIHAFLYPHSKSSASSQNNKTLSILDSHYNTHSHQPDPRQVNERAFFSEASGTLLKTSLYKPCSQSGYSHLDLKVEPPQQPLRHFFDERPPKSKGSWLGLGDDKSDRSSHSTTQLSISLPFYSHDFFK